MVADGGQEKVGAGVGQLLVQGFCISMVVLAVVWLGVEVGWFAALQYELPPQRR